MTIEIIRHNYSKYGVEGTMFINKREICATLEHPHNFLPPGSYPIELERNEHYERDLPTMPDGATIRPGNGPFNLKDGSIVVGERYMLGVLFKSAETFEKLIKRIKMTMARGKEVELRILNFEF
ncbi:DUF5675 family protein [uncultured Prevotella sp.]|uniref:DUF5675 family protein n=1 Tax=uncultured Prevotella sp. TaxID=159272 RepID=UPI0027E25954|nr:DUF5675 family protein [uncultured Prevotella sp.]